MGRLFGIVFTVFPNANGAGGASALVGRHGRGGRLWTPLAGLVGLAVGGAGARAWKPVRGTLGVAEKGRSLVMQLQRRILPDLVASFCWRSWVAVSVESETLGE